VGGQIGPLAELTTPSSGRILTAIIRQPKTAVPAIEKKTKKNDAYSAPLFFAEATRSPFTRQQPEPDPVQLTNSYARLHRRRTPLDYRSDMVIYDPRRQALRCSSTVNSPCTYKASSSTKRRTSLRAQVSVRDVATASSLQRNLASPSKRRHARENR